jgi:hypothetical protein
MTFGRPPLGKFVFQKVNKIRWRPAQTQSGRIDGTHFVTGSWDDEVIHSQSLKCLRNNFCFKEANTYVIKLPAFLDIL